MAMLSSTTENRIFMLGLGLTTCAVLGLMHHMLVVYRDSVELKKNTPKTQYITQETEDSLRSSTLEKLINSHNYGIQETAARIICDRALHDNATTDALLWEVTRPDHDTREKAIRALYMLSDQPGMANLNTPKVYNAIVTSLTHCLLDVPHERFDKDFNNFVFRDAAERFCLLVLCRLVTEFGPQGAIKAGFVHKWLVKEPWGSTETEIQANFIAFCRTLTTLPELVLRIAYDSNGLDQLVKAKLISHDDLHLFTDRTDIGRINGEDTGEGRGLPEVVVLAEGGPRPREHNAEERNLRRRHREAMVLNDGVQPIGVGDIIEREYESPDEERRQSVQA